MDGRELFQSVLNAGERLVWTGPRRQPFRAAAAGLPVYAVMVVGFGSIFRKMFALWNGPLPLYLQAELLIIAAGFLFPIFWFWVQLKKMKNTAYALTNRRLLIAVGPEREKIRAVPLEALDGVRVVQGRRGKVLCFGVRTSGAMERWPVEDPESVKELIETARGANG